MEKFFLGLKICVQFSLCTTTSKLFKIYKRSKKPRFSGRMTNRVLQEMFLYSEMQVTWIAERRLRCVCCRNEDVWATDCDYSVTYTARHAGRSVACTFGAASVNKLYNYTHDAKTLELQRLVTVPHLGSQSHGLAASPSHSCLHRLGQNTVHLFYILVHKSGTCICFT